MALLTKLKLTDKTHHQVKVSDEDRLRDKLISRLVEQKELAEAELIGKPIAKTRIKVVADAATGDTKRVEVAKQLRRWWWTDETGSLMFTLRYGNKPLAIADGKCTIEIGMMEKLPAVIDTIIDAVKGGELDKQLAATAAERRAKMKQVR